MVRFKPFSLRKVCEIVGGEIVAGAADLSFSGLAEPQDAERADISFLISENFLPRLARSQAGLFVVAKALLPKIDLGSVHPETAIVAAEDAYLGFARFSKAIVQENEEFDWTALSSPTSPNDGAVARDSARISPSARFGRGVEVGAGTVIHAGAVLGDHVKVGEDCVIFPNAVVYSRCVIGSRVRLHAGVVIGGDGFGYAKGPAGSEKIYHLGRVRIGDDVEIGAGSTVDRGTIRDTVIEQGVKIDNLVQIGHNVHIKAHAILCAQVGLAGNVTIGRGAILAGKAGVADKLEVGDGAIIGPMSGLSKNVPAGEVMMGQQPARERRRWWKLLAYQDRLPEFFERVKKLEKGEGT